MKILKWSAMLLLCGALGSAQATEVNGVTLPETLQVDNTSLALNGAGVRNKYFMKVYVAGLYVPEPSSDAAAIMNADEVQAMRVEITSSMITRSRFQETVQEGLKQSAGDEYPKYEHMLDELWADENLDVDKGDVFEYRYVPGEGTQFLRNGTTLKVVRGLDFKRVLFGIYLGDNPVQASLKAELLGQ
jgi:hypothetical protein